MKTIYKKQYEALNQCLKIKNIISVRFSNTKNLKFKKFKDTCCTAMARSFKKEINTYIDRERGQLCPGGNYFLNIKHSSIKEVCNVYMKDEKVFENNLACNACLEEFPKYPKAAEKRYILFTPLFKESKKPNVILFLANPAQASRILGLSVYKKMSFPSVVPALSTCASIYAPIIDNNIHLNFIDYYDRYYQGEQKGRLLWNDSDLLISMPFGIFNNIIRHIPLSAHGTYKAKIEPQKIDNLCAK